MKLAVAPYDMPGFRDVERVNCCRRKNRCSGFEVFGVEVFEVDVFPFEVL